VPPLLEPEEDDEASPPLLEPPSPEPPLEPEPELLEPLDEPAPLELVLPEPPPLLDDPLDPPSPPDADAPPELPQPAANSATSKQTDTTELFMASPHEATFRAPRQPFTLLYPLSGTVSPLSHVSPCGGDRHMNRWIRRVVTFSSLAGALALVSGGVALANEQGEASHAKGEHGRKHHGGLITAALKLDSLSGGQKTQIEKLVEERKVARVPVRQADARVLTELAHQVEQAKIDRAGLKGGLDAETAAAQQERSVAVSALGQLHSILTPAQRGQLVDAVQARMPQGKQLPAGLASFRGDSFDAAAVVRLEVPGEHAIKHAEEKVPAMSPQERANLASHLRERAAKESK